MDREDRFNRDIRNISAREPWQMSFEEFSQEYESVMQAVAAKEVKGKLDPNQQPYEPVSEEEKTLLANDWKAFSRKRGFDEDDIKEYERWLILSGQRDRLDGAINDPWRRGRFGWDKYLYLKHIEKAQAEGKEIDPTILESYSAVSTNSANKKTVESPSTPKDSSIDNVW